MKYKLAKLIIIFPLVATFGCGERNQIPGTSDSEKVTRQKAQIRTDTIHKDPVGEAENFKQDDLQANKFLSGKLKSIRANFKRINSIANWTTIDEKFLSGTVEGGHARFFYAKEQLEKIATREFGETFQIISEYYLLNGRLSFVLQKIYRYNRPMYWDSTAMKESNDTEVFDFSKSELMEQRSYFENGVLLHQLNNQDGKAHFEMDDFRSGERIFAEFDALMKLANQ